MSEQSSTIRADVQMKFYARFVILGIAALGMAGWFFKDGLVTWPHQTAVWDAYNELKPDSEHETGHGHGDHGEGPAEHSDDFPQEAWEAKIAEQGWADSVVYQEGQARQPMGKHRTPFELKTQIILGSIFLPVGLGFLLKVFMARGMWIETDGEQLTSSWGKGFRYEEVTQINKKKWKDKGLASIKHNGGSFVVDDLKFERKATDAILYQLEQTVGIDKIVGGRPEEDPNAEPDDESDDESEAEPNESALDSTEPVDAQSATV